MDKAELVNQDIEDGARLIQELTKQGFSVSSATWAHLPEVNEWRLILASPRVASRSTSYRRIQKVINNLNLALPLSRITLVSDDEPSIRNLRALIEADQSDSTTFSTGPTEISGQSIDRGHSYRPGPLEYERKVISALERLRKQGSVLETHWTVSTAGTDAILSTPNKDILVEVKALHRPVDQQLVRTIVSKMMEFQRYSATQSSRPIALLIVSQSGFTAAALNYAASLSLHMRLVQWENKRDDTVLEAAIESLANDGT